MPENENRQQNNRRSPAFTVQDEIKRDRRIRRNAQIRKARENSYKAITLLLCVAVFLITASAIVFAVTRVETITVIGNARYTREDILAAAEVEGAVLPFLTGKTVEKKVVAACPYVNSIELKKTYPSTLEIVVTEAAAVYTAFIRGGQYSLDSDLRVIDSTESKDGLIELYLPEVVRAVEGEKIEFYDAVNAERVPELLEAFFKDENALPLTSLNLVNRFSISGTVGESIKINFGDYNDIPIKLNAAHQLIQKAVENKSSRTLVNVSALKGTGPSVIYDYEGEF